MKVYPQLFKVFNSVLKFAKLHFCLILYFFKWCLIVRLFALDILVLYLKKEIGRKTRICLQLFSIKLLFLFIEFNLLFNDTSCQRGFVDFLNGIFFIFFNGSHVGHDIDKERNLNYTEHGCQQDYVLTCERLRCYISIADSCNRYHGKVKSLILQQRLQCY